METKMVEAIVKEVKVEETDVKETNENDNNTVGTGSKTGLVTDARAAERESQELTNAKGIRETKVSPEDPETVAQAASLEDPASYRTRIPPLGGRMEAAVLHVIQDELLFICAAEEWEELMAFQTDLQDCCLTPQPAGRPPSALQLVTFRSAQDGMWYRGVVLGASRAGQLKVFAPDYGFREKVSGRRPCTPARQVGAEQVRAAVSPGVAGRPYSARPCKLANRGPVAGLQVIRFGDPL
jgi:hypothetical protein